MNKLEHYRKKQGLTQEEVANKLNISVMSYYRYESGKRKPDVAIALKLEKVLHATTRQLFG